MVQRRDFLKTASLGALNAVVPAFGQGRPATASATDKPNILIIVSDEHRAGLTRRSGYPLDTSPALDSLAAEGVGCDRAYATAPLCSPSRATILTGRWPEAHHVRQNSQRHIAYFEKDIYDVAKSAGYRTGLAGKNDTYVKPEKLDFCRQYSHMFGWKPANAPKEYHEYEKWLHQLGLHGLGKSPTPFPLEVQFPYRIVSDAIDFMEQCGDQRFALEISFPEPHNPIQVPKPYFDMYPPAEVPDRCAGPEALKLKGYQWRWLWGLEDDTYPHFDKDWRRYKSDYLGMLRLLDDQLTRLVAYMKKKGIYENTLIVYLADHGDYVMDYGLAGKGAGMPESLIRIPMVWSGGAVRARNEHHPAFMSNADIMPTCCEAIGEEIPHGVQGRSLWPLLEGKDYPEEEFRSIYSGVGFGGMYYDSSDHVPYLDSEFALTGRRRHPAPGEARSFDDLNKVDQSGYMKMVRMGDWKLLYDMMGYGQLYHLPSDPCELKNLFGQPSVKEEQMRLLEELLAWTIRTQDTLPTGAYVTKWATREHNWYTPYRHGNSPEAFIP